MSEGATAGGGGDRRSAVERLRSRIPPVAGEALAATALGAAWVLAFFAPLLAPSRLLATRDVLFLQLPMRRALAELSHGGLVAWNPWVNGGQPLLSNPNYAALYPPTWLAFVTEPHHALGLGIVLHAGLAFAGAWLLARHLGARPAVAALAAVGFSGGGGFVSLTHAYNAFCATAWLPWALLAADAALRTRTRRWWLPALGAGAALALQLLAGEPVTAAFTALLVVLFAVGPVRARPSVAGRLALVAAAALLLSAVQLVPFLARVADSPRAGGVEIEAATAWSTHPARLLEAVYPRPYGDPARAASALYFAWSLHDRDRGYLLSIYPGLLLAVLGLAALLGRGAPRHGAWVVAAALGVLLALGRHTPVYPWLHEHLPGLSLFRFPEKFLLLALVAVVFAGALGWGRLLDAGRQGPRLPLWMALVVATGAAAGVALLTLAPGTVGGWMRAGIPAPLTEAGLERGVSFLRAGAVRTLALALGVVLLIVLARRSRLPKLSLAALAVVLLAADLWGHGRGLVRTADAGLLASPPPVVTAVAPGARVFTDDSVVDARDVVRPGPDPELAQLRTQLARLDPWSANLWGLGYALNADFDRMLTPWGTHALQLLHDVWPDRRRLLPLVGSWNVATLVLRRPLEVRRRELRAGVASPAVEVVANPHSLPWVRSVQAVHLHADRRRAVVAAAAQGWDVARRDHWIAPAKRGGARRGGSVHLVNVRDLGDEVRVRYRAPRGGLLVVASTFDPGWTARAGEHRLTPHPTAVGQIGLELPAGEHELVLRYRDPWLTAGLAVTAATVFACLLLLFLSRHLRSAG